MKTDFYKTCMYLGQMTGCHQRPDRSFFFHGHQFPVCARCTGVILGQIIALATFRVFLPNIFVLSSFCIIMLIDWGLQFFGLFASNNIRRVVTGAMCGYALGLLYIKGFVYLLSKYMVY